MEPDYERALRHGGIVDAGSHSATTREEWWYPDYVANQCPGLPQWQALRSCAALFSEGGSDQRGIFHTGPWERFERERIRALDLPLEIRRHKDSDALWRLLRDAVEERKPILIINWTPNWIQHHFPGQFVEFPPARADCKTDPQAGPNPHWRHDCGNPRKGWLRKVAWKGTQDRWPCAFGILQNMDFSNGMINALTARVDGDGRSVEQAADSWIGDNETLWREWIPALCGAVQPRK